MPHKHICSCGAPQFKGESLINPRSEKKGGLYHEYEETFNVWICEFCGKKEKVLSKASRQSNGINQPRKYLVNQYASALVKISKRNNHIRVTNFTKILERIYPERALNEILEDMLIEGILQIDYTMRNANRDSFIPMRLRLNPDFENYIREILDENKGIESIDKKITRIKQKLTSVYDSRINNPQSEKIRSILNIQQNILSKEEIPYFKCGLKNCLVRNDNNRYETILIILLKMLNNVVNEEVILSSNFCSSINLNGTCLSEYRSDLESILNSKLVFFGILKNVEPLYIPPNLIPIEVSAEIEHFENNLRSFIKTNLLNCYTSIDNLFNDAFLSIFHNKTIKNLNKKMIQDLQSDYDKTKDHNIKIAIDIALTSESYNRFLLDRFFEAMVWGDLIEIIDHEWDIIFLEIFSPLNKDDVLTKMRIIKDDRNIKSHSKSKIPNTFKTLTCIYEFNTKILKNQV